VVYVEINSCKSGLNSKFETNIQPSEAKVPKSIVLKNIQTCQNQLYTSEENLTPPKWNQTFTKINRG